MLKTLKYDFNDMAWKGIIICFPDEKRLAADNVIWRINLKTYIPWT